MSILRGLLVIMAILSALECAVVTQELSVSKQDVDGQVISEFGSTINSSLIRLIGQALINHDSKLDHLCQSTPCSPWGNWTVCSAKSREFFGYQTRSRRCWYGSSDACKKDGDVTIENESKVCETYCIPGYKRTKTDLCVKLNTTSTSQPDAEKVCSQDGGHLMNIDTAERWEVFLEMVKGTSLGDVWIDGTRTTAGGTWSYKSGSDPTTNGVDEWRSGEPSNDSYELCKVADDNSGVWYWRDRDCLSKYAFMCEIRL